MRARGSRLGRAVAATRAVGRALRDFLRGFLDLPATLPGPDDGGPDTTGRDPAAAARRALEARNARRGSCC